jgi:hypothetical protein
MDTPELFPGEREVREEAARAGWSASVGNGWAAVFVSPENDGLTLRAYVSFFEAGMTPVYLLVETLEGDPARAPLEVAIYTMPFSAAGGGTPTKVSGSELGEHVDIAPPGMAGLDPTVAFSPDGQYLAYSFRFENRSECFPTCDEQPWLDGIYAETRMIPVGGGSFSRIQYGEFQAQTQVVWAPASSDTTAPQMTLPDITLEATGPGGARWVGLNPEDMPKDDVDPNPSLTCITRAPSGSFFTAFGRTFPLDTTATVSCTAEDATGKRTTDRFDLTVKDTTAPAISAMPSDKVVEATGANGAQASWPQPTARDLVSGFRPVS